MVQRSLLLQPHVQPSDMHARDLLAQMWWSAITSSRDSLFGVEGLSSLKGALEHHHL